MARHLRHHHVKYHEVRLLAFDLSKRLRAGTGGADRVTFGLQEITQDLHDVVRIVHDKNFGLLGHDFWQFPPRSILSRQEKSKNTMLANCLSPRHQGTHGISRQKLLSLGAGVTPSRE